MNLKNINELLEEANEEVSIQKKTLANELDNLEECMDILFLLIRVTGW